MALGQINRKISVYGEAEEPTGNHVILRIPNPVPGVEAVVRARAAFTAGLPLLPFAVPRVREISHVEGILITIEDRIAPDRGKAWGGGRRAAGALCRMDCVQLCLSTTRMRSSTPGVLT